MLATQVDNTSILVSTGAPLSDLALTKNDQNMCCTSSSQPATDSSASPVSKKIRKSVSFHEENRIHHVPSLSDMQSKEMRAIWLSDSDYEGIQKSAKRTVRAIQSGTTKNIDCARGFENLFTDEVLSLTEKQKELTRAKVLEAQDYGASAEDLANVSMQHTKEAKERALAAAAMDEDHMRRCALEAKLKKTENEEKKNKGLRRIPSLASLSFGPPKRRNVFGRATLPRYSLELSN